MLYLANASILDSAAAKRSHTLHLKRNPTAAYHCYQCVFQLFRKKCHVIINAPLYATQDSLEQDQHTVVEHAGCSGGQDYAVDWQQQ